MNVSGWNLASKMKLPDHCFGDQILIGLHIVAWGAGAKTWVLSPTAWPDPACIWSFGVWVGQNNHFNSYIRLGLSDTLPANEGQMDLTQPVFPSLGYLPVTPPKLYMPTASGEVFAIQSRIGIVTGGKKLALESVGGNTQFSGDMYLLISAMPDKVPGWPGSWPAG